ncbi:hypothetical protein GCM10027070_24710 [Barrientosiimonas humi]
MGAEMAYELLGTGHGVSAWIGQVGTPGARVPGAAVDGWPAVAVRAEQTALSARVPRERTVAGSAAVPGQGGQRR